MPSRHRWDPDWVVAPGETLREWITDTGLSLTALAVTCGRIPVEELQGVLDRHPLSHSTALALHRGTGIPARFWLALEHNYRVGLAAGKRDCS